MKEKLLDQITNLKLQLQDLEQEQQMKQELILSIKSQLTGLESINLDNTDDNAPEEHSNALLKVAVQFEESHPKLASSINDIASLLANMGI